MWHVRDQAQEKLIPISVLHIWQLDIRQWGTGSCNTVRTLPLALSTFKVAFAMHQGTVTNTVIISSQDYASSLTQVKFLTNNSNDTAFVMYIIIGR